MTGDAEILPEHVARKDIGSHQILDGIAIFDHCMLDLFASPGVIQSQIKGFLQVDVKRNHPSLDVQMLDHHLLNAITVAVRNFNLTGRIFLDFLEQFGLETLQRKGHFTVFHRVCHAPDAVVLAHQLVFGPYLLACGVLLGRIKILDQLEHIGK